MLAQIVMQKLKYIIKKRFIKNGQMPVFFLDVIRLNYLLKKLLHYILLYGIFNISKEERK